MKPLLNTLYVTAENSYLSKEGDQVVLKVAKEERLRVPVHTLQSIVCFGPVTVTPFMMNLAAEHGVGFSFLTENGKFLARVDGPVRGNVLLRREQYRRADDPAGSLAAARCFIVGKIANSRVVLQRALRDHGDPASEEPITAAIKGIARVAERLPAAQTLDEARGREGEAADHYFGVFDHLIVAQKDFFQFKSRSRRPPLDPVNALLSFLYTLLSHDVQSALEAVGLDPAVGFLHRDRPGRHSLALDLMEEMRPLLADRLALTLINRQQLSPSDFRATESAGILLQDGARKTVLKAWQNRKQEEITHPWLGEKMPMGMIPHVQALLLARYLRGDYDAYPAFIWK
ncbi:type I-C CRISPR-associated endonuclease Cas1c [soil metagenome]